jgi:pilus assembly protein CpaC
MHRTKNAPTAVLRGLLAALALGLLTPALALAQPKPEPVAPPAPAPTLTVAINGTTRLQMSKKQVIARAINHTEAVIRLAPAYNDPTTVLVTGLEPGIARVTLIDEKGNEENFEIIVQLDVELLKSLLRRAVPTANIVPIPGANNTVILTGTVSRVEDIEIALRTTQSVVLGADRVINALRVGGVQQVQLCVVVAQVSRSEFRRMAFNFLYSGPDWFLGSTVGQAVANPGIVGVGSPQLNIGGIVSGTPGAPNGAPTNAFFGILNNGSGFLGFLQALRDENVTKLLAEPRLVTLSGNPASFVSGGEQAIPVPAGLGQVGVRFEEFGTELAFLPLVLGNGKIHLRVAPAVRDLNQAFGTIIQGTVVPGRTTQRVDTTVEIEAGQTLVIGGLIQHNVVGAMQKVPVLGDIPYLGAAFSTKSFEERETELVVLVTPYLVDPMSCDQLPKHLPGQETRSPDDFELFLEGILEAPRGQRQIRAGKRYVAAYKNGPTAGQYPCGGGVDGACGPGGSCNGDAGCVGGAGCGTTPPVGAHPAHAATAPAAETVTPTAGADSPPAMPTPAATGAEERPAALPPLLKQN